MATQSTSHAPVHHARKSRRDFYDWLDMAIKTAGIAFAVIAAFQAAGTYDRDVQEKYLDQKIKFVDDVLTAAGQVVIAQDYKSNARALDAYGVIKHGQGIALFGDDNTYRAMIAFWNFCAERRDDLVPAKYDPRANYLTVEPTFENLANAFHANIFTPEVATS